MLKIIIFAYFPPHSDAVIEYLSEPVVSSYPRCLLCGYVRRTFETCLGFLFGEKKETYAHASTRSTPLFFERVDNNDDGTRKRKPVRRRTWPPADCLPIILCHAAVAGVDTTVFPAADDLPHQTVVSIV